MVQPAMYAEIAAIMSWKAFICIRLLPLSKVTALTIMPSAGS
jgi:hypothetical protein